MFRKRNALVVALLAVLGVCVSVGCDIRIDRDDGASIEDRATQAALDWLDGRFGDD